MRLALLLLAAACVRQEPARAPAPPSRDVCYVAAYRGSRPALSCFWTEGECETARALLGVTGDQAGLIWSGRCLDGEELVRELRPRF